MQLAEMIGRRAVRAVALAVIALLFAPQVLPGAGGLPAMAQTSAAAGGPASGKALFGAAPSESNITIIGNRRIERATILSYMQLPTDRPVTAEDLNKAQRRLFDTGLFKDVEIIPTKTGLTVKVVENPSINEIAFEGNSKLTDDDLKKIIKERPRLPFTRSAAEADAQAIIETYRRLGRYGAKVEPKIIQRSDNRVDVVFEISEGPVTGVTSIEFVGNDHFSDRTLRGIIETRESSWLSALFSNDTYDPDRLELDKQKLRQYYLKHGYADFAVLSATAELSPDRTGFYITFTVSEGPQYTFGTMNVAVQTKGLDPKDFEALLPKDIKGETYDATLVDKLTNKLTDLAGQKGYAFVQTTPKVDKDTENHVINITFDLAEGSKIYVERIDIEGNVRTLDRVIRRDMKLVEGDAFDTRKIRESRTNIRALNYFKSVDIQTKQGSAPDRAILTVKVKEKSTGSLSLSVGFSSSVGPIGSVALTENNFLGRGQIINAKVTASGNTQVYNFSFTEPRFLDRDLSVTGAAFYIHDNRKSSSSYRSDTYGINPSVSFPLSEDLRLGLNYLFAADNVVANGLASPLILDDTGKRITSAVGYTLTYDKRDDKVEPTSGYLLQFDQTIAGLAGTSRYVKTHGSAKVWQGFFDNDVIATAEAEGGALYSFGQNSRVTDRFLLGGDSLRGFAQYGVGPRDQNTVLTGLGPVGFDDSLGGNYFAAARFEASFPIGLPKELGVYGGAFMDMGTLWGLDKTRYSVLGVRYKVDDKPYFRMSAGALLFLDTPLGPLKLSFGFPLIKHAGDKKELFRLAVGTRF